MNERTVSPFTPITTKKEMSDMYEFAKIGTMQFVLWIIGIILFMGVPVLIAILWTVKKKEKFTSVLTGAVTFLLFALIFEKPIQNVLIFPTAMGLPNHGIAQFINARPVLWAFLVGFFPGLFEETGRFVAFKTVLKNRKNRETSISYGIGHGGFEVMLILGLTYINYITYGIMINSGAYAETIKQIAQVMPDQVDAYLAIPDQLAAFTAGSFAINLYERIFAVLFHIGASILVFYACRDRKKIWLYPLAIILHTLMDGIMGLALAGVIGLSDWGLEGVCTVMGLAVFFGAYFLLYKKDSSVPEKADIT
ncbi:MAG: YhfC family intramembrane metalloprotease [Lachnospiraceae bacterium]|nr:YhfC family intramembrane metalloprotease [Lachnospiraceae bacterium]